VQAEVLTKTIKNLTKKEEEEEKKKKRGGRSELRNAKTSYQVPLVPKIINNLH